MSGLASGLLRGVVLCLTAGVAGAGAGWAQTALGEIEDRPAPVGRRICLGGGNAGALCNENADCPGSTCKERNVFNLSVAVHYDAPAADLTAIQNLITDASATLLDVTDGQAEIGQATIHNNAFGTTEADLRVYPATCTAGTSLGAACAGDADCPPAGVGECGVWWYANTGSFKTGGSMHVSQNFIDPAIDQGPTLAHEFVHLIVDARDEYETRPACAADTDDANCPDAATIAAGQGTCLMDRNGTELCWGQGDPGDLTDVTAGNHDATNVTEQSQCRSNRSCWDQVVWSWPDTMLKPAAAPDPGSGGAVATPPSFVMTEDTIRVVLVLDESGSMDLESPTRMERLKVAAKDFIALAESGAEVGIVSFASDAAPGSGRVSLAIDALGADRSDWNDAIDGLDPDTRTNIGDGLDAAHTQITAAGGVTGNTYVVLMTDGLNNEPSPQADADADLTAEIADLLAAGIPVYVTCTGGDLGLQSQCAEIAAGTNGFYVDSADAARLPEAFVDLHERLTGHEAITSLESHFSKIKSAAPMPVFVDAGSDAVSFVLSWREADANAEFHAVAPDGTLHRSQPMPQGRFVRVERPLAGDWQLVVRPAGTADSRFVLRAYTRHRVNNLIAAMRYPTVLPGEPMTLFAYPKGPGGALTDPDAVILARVTLPDGSGETVELRDAGRDAAGEGDDVAGDGIFTGVLRDTGQKGAYTFRVSAAVDSWRLGHDAHRHSERPRTVRFAREVRLSAAVGDPSDVVTHPEDDPKPGTGTPGDRPCDRRTTVLLVVIVLLLLLLLWMVWRCCRGRKSPD